MVPICPILAPFVGSVMVCGWPALALMGLPVLA
jgi:hypothetical protein